MLNQQNKIPMDFVQYSATEYPEPSYKQNMPVNQSKELIPNIHQELKSHFNYVNTRIDHLESELYAKKIEEQTIVPDHIVYTPHGLHMQFGSLSKFMQITNFLFYGLIRITFPEPIEKNNYYELHLYIVDEHKKTKILLSEEDFYNYKSLKSHLSKNGCRVFYAKGKADEKAVLTLLTNYFINSLNGELIMCVLAGWQPKEKVAIDRKDKYSGIDLPDKMLNELGINKKKLITTDKPNIEIIRGFESVFNDKKIYYFLLAWHIYGIVKNKLPDGITSSLNKILNLKGDIQLGQETALSIFKIFNRDDMYCDLTTLDNIDKINEILLLAKSIVDPKIKTRKVNKQV